MRILMVSDFYYPFLGGVEQHMRSLCSALVERGHEVAVATLGRDGLAEFEIDHGVRVHRMRGSAQRLTGLFSQADRPWAPPIADPELLLTLRRVITEERPDVVHGHDWLVRSFLPLKGWSRASLVVSLHYYTLSCAKKSLMHRGSPCGGPGLGKCARCAVDHYGFAKGYPTLAANWAGAAHERNAVDMFLPVSLATAAGNGLVGSEWPYQVVPNFVPSNARLPRGDLSPYIDQLPAGDFLLFVGDPRPEKGLDVLIDAYAALDDAPPLVLIGKVWPDGPRAFPPNVIPLENWPNYAILEAWRRSLIALAPSIWPEPCATVVIEAMVSGRPVIASRIGGMPDLIVDGETGYLIPPGDPTALRQAIECLLYDPERRERMGQSARHKVRDFQADVVVPRIERIYQEVVARAASDTPLQPLWPDRRPEPDVERVNLNAGDDG